MFSHCLFNKCQRRTICASPTCNYMKDTNPSTLKMRVTTHLKCIIIYKRTCMYMPVVYPCYQCSLFCLHICINLILFFFSFFFWDLTFLFLLCFVSIMFCFYSILFLFDFVSILFCFYSVLFLFCFFTFFFSFLFYLCCFYFFICFPQGRASYDLYCIIEKKKVFILSCFFFVCLQ